MNANPAVTAPRKVMLRLVPFAMLLLFFSLIDRTNISFAALRMNADLGLTPRQYGFAAGVFFLAYCLFEVPSNLLLLKFGARAWLARIMISWGVVVVAMSAVSGATSFYVLRFLLGIAEAGLLPGVFYYFCDWVPARQRGLVYSVLMSTTALGNVLSGPFATGLMQLHGPFGLHGWQLMFMIEGIPTIVLGALIPRCMPATPADATWLDAGEKRWLTDTIAAELAQKARTGTTSFVQGLMDPRVMFIAVLGFLFVTCNFGTVFWLPQMIRSIGGLSDVQIGFITSIPFLFGGLATIYWGRHSDRHAERKWHLVSGALLAAAGYALAGLTTTQPALAFFGLCIAVLGIWSMFGVYWAYAADVLGGAAAAGGFALINSVSVFGGFVGPVIVGMVRAKTESFSGSLLILGGFAIVTAAAALLIGKSTARQSQLNMNPASTGNT